MTHEHGYVGQLESPDFGGPLARGGDARRTLPVYIAGAEDKARVHPSCPFRPVASTIMGGRIVVRVQPPEEKAGRIIIPETALDKKSAGSTWTGERAACDLHGTIVAIGPGRLYGMRPGDTPRRVPVDLSLGDVVYFGPHASDAEVPGHKEFLVMTEEDILFVAEKNSLRFPLDRILVRKIAEKPSSLILPVDAPNINKARVEKGEVVAVGKGTRNAKGELIPLDLRPRDVILFPTQKGIEVRIKDQVYLVMREEDVLGVEEIEEAA